MASKQSEIKLYIELDENQIPEKLQWTAEDGGVINQDSKAILLSVWNHQEKQTMKIDLWTKDMPVDEMKRFFYETLVAMSDSFERATADSKMADTMRDFCDYFAEKLELKA